MQVPDAASRVAPGEATGRTLRRSPEGSPERAPDVVIIGAATRDLNDEDPRGWLLGGGVTFGALALARMGIRIGVVLGLDAESSGARELELLEHAGARVVEVPLERGPIFRNVETPNGRVQTCESTSSHIPPAAVPRAWRGAGTWMLAPVASEIGPEWVDEPPGGACVVFAWQGILRHLEAGTRVRPLPPGPSPLLSRADIVAVSRHDIPTDMELREIGSWLAPEAELLLTAGPLGGLLLRFQRGRIVAARGYPGVPSDEEVDPAGAGDTMLAGLVAARVAVGREGTRRGRDLHVGAAASSVLVEGPGMDALPTFRQLRARLARRP